MDHSVNNSIQSDASLHNIIIVLVITNIDLMKF
jgi:hypothetical protein